MTPVSNYVINHSSSTGKSWVEENRAPDRQLLPGSIELRTNQLSNNEELYTIQQNYAHFWEETKKAASYLTYCEIKDIDNITFTMVPFKKSNMFTRILRQMKVLWGTIFGGTTISKENCNQQAEEYTQYIKKKTEPLDDNKVDDNKVGSDAFCNEEVLKKQCILEGKHIRILFNYAPVTETHFLIIPKRHCENFHHLTQDEYKEAMKATELLYNHYTEEKTDQKTAYLLHKTGKDAGQTVPHWHQHVIIANRVNGIFGKLIVAKNILFGSSAMRPNALETKVTDLRKEFNIKNYGDITVYNP